MIGAQPDGIWELIALGHGYRESDESWLWPLRELKVWEMQSPVLKVRFLLVLIVMKHKIKIAMFTGGRGSSSITRSLLKNPAVSLTNIINAYDDGRSTGRLRAFLPGYLGPSDARKNITTLMREDSQASRSLKALMEYRFAADMTQEEIVKILEAMASAGDLAIEDVRRHWLGLLVRTEYQFRKALQTFLDTYHERAAKGEVLDLRDASLGNLMMTGEYLRQGRSFNDMIASVSALCEIRGKVLNVSEGDNRYLVGLKEDGTILSSEATLVGPQSPVKIKEIYLLAEALSLEETDRLMSFPIEERARRLMAMNRPVHGGEECLKTLEDAALIIFPPGTQNSSLLPSYLSVGIGEAIAGNTGARKIFVSNLREDHEIPKATANSLIETCIRYLNRRGELSFSTDDYITDVFVHKCIGGVEKDAAYLYFNFDSPGYENLRVKESDWEARYVPGLHNGDQVATQIHNVIRDHKPIEEFYYTASIIMPALNEQRAIADVLRHLTQVDYVDLNLSVEVVVVDGGSTDRTVDEARAIPGVKVYQLPKGTFGKGAAIKHGLENTVSDLVAIFPADGEYPAEEVRRLLKPLAARDCEVTLGARNLRPHSAEDALQKIYGSKHLLYYTSLISGRLLSLLTYLLYGRFISDPLTSVRAFVGNKLRPLATTARGFDYDQEVLAILLRQDATIFEIPVRFKPRTRGEGKKIRLSDGLKSLWSLVRCRFRRLPTLT